MATTTRSERIKTAREAKGWSLEELGSRIGVKKATVSKWENHKNGKPDIELDVFFDLARVLELDARELATGMPPDPSDVAPNMRALVDDFEVIDTEVRGPIRALISTLAEQVRAAGKQPRKARDKTKVRARLVAVEKPV